MIKVIYQLDIGEMEHLALPLPIGAQLTAQRFTVCGGNYM